MFKWTFTHTSSMIYACDFNHLSTNSTKWLDTLKQFVSEIDDELFECVWPISEIKRLTITATDDKKYKKLALISKTKFLISQTMYLYLFCLFHTWMNTYTIIQIMPYTVHGLSRKINSLKIEKYKRTKVSFWSSTLY